MGLLKNEASEGWVEFTPFIYMNDNHYLEGVGMYSYQESKKKKIKYGYYKKKGGKYEIPRTKEFSI